MVTQITRGIKITVLTGFEGTFLKNYRLHFAFSYQITIENHSKDSVQLISSHWDIFDALNDPEVVEGEGVVGLKPVLKPGESHSYSSGCFLESPFGSMKGYFNMVNFTSTRKFKVVVPSFKLSVPYALN